MFDVFGEFDSAEEINKAAAGQKSQGDNEAIRQLAMENGIDAEDAEDYISGAVEELCNPLMAAFGKIDLEAEELKAQEIFEDWINYIRTECTQNENMAAAVRKKGKSVKKCIAELLKWSFKNMYAVDKDIVEAAGVKTQVKMGIPGMAHAREIITKYYLDIKG